MAKKKATVKITHLKTKKLAKFKATKMPKTTIKIKAAKPAKKVNKVGGRTFKQSSSTSGVVSRSRQMPKVGSSSKQSSEYKSERVASY